MIAERTYDAMDYIIQEILNLLREEGLYIEYTGDDLDLRDYLVYSVQYIGFIVDIEKKFNIEIPDEYLLYDSIASLHSFAKLIESCKEEKESAHND